MWCLTRETSSIEINANNSLVFLFSQSFFFLFHVRQYSFCHVLNACQYTLLHNIYSYFLLAIFHCCQCIMFIFLYHKNLFFCFHWDDEKMIHNAMYVFILSIFSFFLYFFYRAVVWMVNRMYAKQRDVKQNKGENRKIYLKLKHTKKTINGLFFIF